MKRIFNKLLNFLLNIGVPKHCKCCRHNNGHCCYYNYSEECTKYKDDFINPPTIEEIQMYNEQQERELHEYYLKQFGRL